MTIKKTLSGFFYRAFRSIETYIFLLLMMLISIPVIIDLEKDETINPLCFAIAYSSIIPLIITALYTIVFFSKLFREDTMVNLTLTGHSKKEIFAAAWIYSVSFVAFYLILFTAEAFIAVNMIYRQYQTDTGLLFLMFGGSFLLCLFFITLTTSLLFVSRNTVMTIIVTVIIVYLSISVPARLISDLMFVEVLSHDDSVRLSAYEKEGKDVSWRFETDDLRIRIYIDGEPFEYQGKKDPDALTGKRRTMAKTAFYAFPTSFYFLSAAASGYEVTDLVPFYLSTAGSVLYTVFTLGLGMHLFSRRDI